MSLRDAVASCGTWQPDEYRPFVVDGRPVGRVRHDFARRLGAFASVLEVGERAVLLRPGLADFASRTEALDEVLQRLHEEAAFTGWRGERYPVMAKWGEAPLLALERAAVPCFGVRGYGVHLNGLVGSGAGLRMWVARRSRHKATGPGKLDQLVAGGQPHGIGVSENLAKECAEEADIGPDLAARAVPVGIVSYRCERPEGLRDDVLFCFDLDLPPDFAPRNMDGEIEDFYLWPIEKVMERVSETLDFKFNCALVVIDFLIRRGYLAPDDPDYAAIIHGLRLPD